MNLPAHGGQLRRIAAHYGIPAHEILDFSANINPEGPPASVLAALHRALEDPATLTNYPDLDLQALKQSIADHLNQAAVILSAAKNLGSSSEAAGSLRAPSIRSLTPNGWEVSSPPATSITPQNLSIANGFVPLLEATIRTRKIRRCLLPIPSFSEYRRTLELNGVEVIPYPLPQNRVPHVPLQGRGFSGSEQPFHYNPEALLSTLNQTNSDAILLANPQNPSGHLTPAAVLSDLIANTQATILLDEAFVDYAPTESLTTAPLTHPNLIVFRSVTKFFAMPGLRVAYCVSHPDTARQINEILPPWPITTLSTHAVQAALADEPYHHLTRTLNQTRRESLSTALTQLGITPYPAAANFLLLPLPSDAQQIWQSLLTDHQIHLRTCTNFESLPGPHLRTAIRTEPENARLITALRAIL